MLVKGSLNRERLPIIKINGKNVRYVEQVKYLGVVIDKILNFVAHVRYLRTKVLQYVSSIRRVAEENWSMKPHIVKVLYGAVPIVKYEAVLWFDRANNIMVKRNLLALERGFLLLTTRVCRTTSTVTM